jgi:uncharacterized protein (TIGR02246 family)
MNRSDVQAWLDQYLDAWGANDATRIAALFTDDATYRYHPYDADDQVLHGRDRIVESWLEQPDDPGTWEASYEAYAADGARAVAVGTSHYEPTATDPERLYHNVFLMDFAPDGRCSSFTEYFMLVPAK